MRYLSVCSGIEAATVAWHPLGWEPVAFSEIERFPSAVLKHHYPTTPNLGDMNHHANWSLPAIDLLVGGTPCQSFSVAGLRQGLADPRGGLMLRFLEIAQRHRPRWVVWENVPGVLSSNGGRDFGTFLGALGELGYGWAYRVLDAQFFGVPQRRRRVFVVGCLGDGERASRVLFERESVRRNIAKGREKGQAVAATITTGFGERRIDADQVCNGNAVIEGSLTGCWWDGGQVSQTLDAVLHKGQMMPEKNRFPAVLQPVTQCGNVAGTLAARHDSSPCVDRGANIVFHPTQDPISSRDVVHAIQARGQATAAVMFDLKNVTSKTNQSNPQLGDPSHTLAASNARDAVVTLQAKQHCSVEDPMIVDQGAMRIRRLTPRECERLQGFPDDYTLIPYRRKTADNCPDGPRYKALGNSMAVPCMRWIGERIAAAN